MSMVTDDDERRVVAALASDVVATVGGGYERHIVDTAAHHREFTVDANDYLQRVVDDVQQWLHDMFIDTTWPACPIHERHPLWFQDGSWHVDGVPAAPLGELALLRRPIVFSYGTLQNVEVQVSTFGRVLDGDPDALPGYELGRVAIADPAVRSETGLTHYANIIRAAATSRVTGMAFRLTTSELLSADRYESDAGYVRTVVALVSGREAWVYAHATSEC